MRLKSMIAMIAALSLGAVPTLASAAQTANPAQSLSLSSATRTGTSTSAKNHLAGGSGVLIALLIVAGIAAILIVDATNSDNSDSN